MEEEDQVGDENILLEGTLGWLFQDVHVLFTRIFDKRVNHIGLTRSQWRVLSPLLRQQGITQTELADLVGIEKAPLGRTLDKLESSGWIYRESDPTDRRARRVYLTGKIEPYLPELFGMVQSLFRDMLKGFSAEDVESLMRLLMAIKLNLRSADLSGKSNP